MTERRFAAILSIDVVGYSRMMQADQQGLLKALNVIFRTVVQPNVSEFKGHVVKLLGDGALITFQSAFDALSCAVSIQERMRSANPPHAFHAPIFLRIGLHAGDVLIEEGDVFGDCVNIASRLQAEAEAGGVLVSRTLRDLVGNDVPYRLRHEGMHSLKNIAQPIETLSVDFTDEKVTARRNRAAETQEIRFCTTKDGVRLAWTATGDGPPVVKAPNWIGHLELDWRSPNLAHVLTSLSAKAQLTRFDARGNGLSDWDVGEISFDRFVDDLECIFDAAKIERASILGISQGSAVAAAFAARAPERVSSIVMIGGFPVGRAKRKSKTDQARAAALKSMMQAGWDDDFPSLRDLIAQMIAPQASTEHRRRYAEDMHEMISPENVGRYRDAIDGLDITGLLPKVQAPCLVLHGKRDRMQPVEQGRQLAAGISNARFISYDSNNHILTENDPCWPLAEREILGFLGEHG